MMNELLRDMEKYADEKNVPIITAQARKVFRKAVREARPARALEIGTAIGYSALIIAEEAPDVQITTLELDKSRAILAKQYIDKSPYKDQIEILIGDAGNSLCQLSGRYDFVFIDAAKGQYPDYWRKIQPLLSERVTVVADNVLFRGYVEGTEAYPRRFRTIVKRLKEYLELVRKTEGFSTEILRDGDGLAVSRRDIREEEKA